MAKGWHIQGFESADDTFDGWASARLSERQVMQLLARLHCRHLTDAEIVAVTEDSEDRAKIDALVIPARGKRGGFMTTGNPYYTAVYEDRDA